MFQRSDVGHAVMENQQRLNNTRGKLEIFAGREPVKSCALLLKLVIAFVNFDEDQWSFASS